MDISKKILTIVAFLFCLAPLSLKAQEPTLFVSDASGNTVVIEEPIVQAEPIKDEMPWWVYVWAGLLVAGVSNMAIKSIKGAMTKQEEEPEQPKDSKLPK